MTLLRGSSGSEPSAYGNVLMRSRRKSSNSEYLETYERSEFPEYESVGFATFS